MARKMKESGIEWIGEIPENWGIRAIKNSFRIYAGSTPKSENPDYYDGDIIWVTPADYKTEDKVVKKGRRTLTREGYESCNLTIVPAGSVIFSKRAPIGSVVIAGAPLCTNQGCLSCVPNNDVSSTYFYYLLSVLDAVLNLFGEGTTFKEISAFTFSNFRLPCPSVGEQVKIAEYLERRCSNIDAVISQTRDSIEEYISLRQSLVEEAVTKGIRGERLMKGSGVNWIQEIPEEWEMVRGKALFREKDVRSESGEEELLTVSQYTGVTPRSQKNVTMFQSESLVGYKICEVGDIAANTMWMWAGAVAVSEYYGVISPSYNVYTQKDGRYESKYLDFLLRTPALVGYYASLSTGIRASRLRLYPEQFLNIYFPVPSRDEQVEIERYLDVKCSAMDKLIEKKTLFLEELENYKKSLIYEYTTGKKEVPAYAG